MYGFIGDVYVDPKFRKQSYGRKLTNEVLDWFSKNEVNTIRLLASERKKTVPINGF
ncbi:MAG: GNAT family N-acetyltransferase [Bacillota bacterium]